jgi:hypothetical protein
MKHCLPSLIRTRNLLKPNRFAGTPEQRKDLPLARLDLSPVSFAPLMHIGEDANEGKANIEPLEKKIEGCQAEKSPKDEFSKQSYLNWQGEVTEHERQLAEDKRLLIELGKKENFLLSNSPAPQQGKLHCPFVHCDT